MLRERGGIRLTKKTILLLSVLVLSTLVILPAVAWTLDSTYDAGASMYGGVRYRAFNNYGNQQVYIGIPPVPAENTVWGAAKTIAYYKWYGTTAFSIEYKPDLFDSGKNFMSTTIGRTSYTRSGSGPVNYLEFFLVNANAGNYVDYEITKINDEPVSYVFTGTGSKYWSALGTETRSLKIDGYIYKHGFPGSFDTSYAEIRFGYLEPKDEQAPVVTGIRISPDPVIRCSNASVTATIDDAATGGSALASAAYSADGGPFTPMQAVDGAFDEVSEDVTATLATDRGWSPGTHTVCVRGTDAAGNPSDGNICNSVTVGYSFEGFPQPIDMAATNSAKAGQAIPAKWKLSDNCGVIADPASFSNLYSYPVTCGELSPVADVVEEYAGSSGLQYSGDGLWQFNWKTPKTYAGTCRVMHVGFDDGQYSDPAAFMFR